MRNPTRLLADPALRGWLSTIFLALTSLTLVGVVVLTWVATVQSTPAACHNAPLRLVALPQWVGILVCVAGFVIGRITARPRITLRRDVRSAVSDKQKHTPEERENFALLLQGSFVAALLFISFLIAFEAVTLGSGVWPITYFMRCANESATLATLAAAGAFCILAGRWLWLPSLPKDED